jgi:hypothetical protein
LAEVAHPEMIAVFIKRQTAKSYRHVVAKKNQTA